MDYEYIIRSVLTPINNVVAFLFSWMFNLFYGWDLLPMIFVTTLIIVGAIYSLVWVLAKFGDESN